MNGLVVLDKPAGLTSHDVVRRMRKAFATKKVGHAGTLDPMATGVLVLGVGRATRLLSYVVGVDKTYDATMLLGVDTNTDDAEGHVTSTATVEELARLDAQSIAHVVAEFEGAISQRPCAVSAIKVAGERSYARVRKGEQVHLPPRTITVHRLSIRTIEQVRDGYAVEVSVHCSSGTYVRALARDIGARLGVGGHLTSLRRTSVGPFGVDQAVPLHPEPSEGDIPAHLIPIDRAISALMPTIVVSAEAEARIVHGRPFPWPGAGEGVTALISPSGTALAVAEPVDGVARYRWVLSEANA